ncbi:unnamed protein product [Diabrotica balteata]|uniref:Uncharacterized protein n=1 Tax=Diabrotica balteata TaxID=107213 RepID=A0A9N9T9S5_DIABA|nr:unnamed protein product [Diabrotica balteata]
MCFDEAAAYCTKNNMKPLILDSKEKIQDIQQYFNSKGDKAEYYAPGGLKCFDGLGVKICNIGAATLTKDDKKVKRKVLCCNE